MSLEPNTNNLYTIKTTFDKKLLQLLHEAIGDEKITSALLSVASQEVEKEGNLLCQQFSCPDHQQPGKTIIDPKEGVIRLVTCCEEFGKDQQKTFGWRLEEKMNSILSDPMTFYKSHKNELINKVKEIDPSKKSNRTTGEIILILILITILSPLLFIGGCVALFAINYPNGLGF